MKSLPFTGRQSELSVLEQGVTNDNEEVLYPVVGPTGIGKSTLLNRFAGDCRNNDIPVVNYSIREPASFDQFLSRLIEQWQETHPGVSSSDVTGVISNLMGNTGRALTAVPGTGLAGRGAGAVLQTVGDLFSEQDESTDPVTEIGELAQQTCELYDSEWFILIIDQFDESRINREVYDKSARFLRDLTTASDTSDLICYVGAQERFYNPTQNTVQEVELHPFDIAAVETYLEQTGFTIDRADEVREAASGNPYFVERIIQIADDRGSISAALNDLSPVEEERYEVLERRFFETLSVEKQQLLKKTCALPELRAEPVAYVTGQDLTKVEAELRELQQQAVVSRIGYDHGQPVYRVHELQLDYLRERTSRQEWINQHHQIAAYYAEQAAESKLESSSELFTEDSEQRLRKFMTAGILFEYHIQKLPRDTPVETHVEAILNEVENINPDRAREALYTYFQQHQPLSLDVEDLGISRQIATDEITEALDTTSSKTRPVKMVHLYQQVKDDERLTDDESELIVLLIDTLRQTVDSTKPNSEVDKGDVRLIEQRITNIEEGDYGEAIKLQPVILVGLRLWYSLLTRDTESTPDISVWEFIEVEYGLTQDDWRVLREAALVTMGALLDLNQLEQRVEQYGETGKHVDEQRAESDTIEQYGLQGGLFRSVSSPVLDGIQSIGNPSPEEIQELTEEWTRLENEFAEDDHRALATLCRDIRQVLLESLTGTEEGFQVGFRLMSAFDRDNVEVTNIEPAESILRAGIAIRSLTNSD